MLQATGTLIHENPLAIRIRPLCRPERKGWLMKHGARTSSRAISKVNTSRKTAFATTFLVSCLLLWHTVVPGAANISSVLGGASSSIVNGSDLHTHGSDDEVPNVESLRADKTAVTCVPEKEKHWEAIYAKPFDGKNGERSQQMMALLRQAIYDASAFMDAEARSVKEDARARFRVLCDSANELLVHNAITDTPSAADHPSTVLQDLEGQGFKESNAKYVVFYDDCVRIDCYSGGTGMGALFDDRPSQINRNNRGGNFAFDWGINCGTFMDTGFTTGCPTKGGNPSWFVVLHEMGHTMGGVQISAPHSSGSGHCNDDPDIMCYADGGPKSNFDRTVCALDPVLPKNSATAVLSPHGDNGEIGRWDCNKDDYFNPAPAADNYLSSHWNIAASYNHFLDHGESGT